MKQKTVSIIIPTYKPDSNYSKMLQVLYNQTYPVEKIVVMNTGKEYYNEDIYPKLDKLEVHHITKKQFDHGGTRNIGVQLTNSDIILFLTQDAMPKGSNFVENMMKAFDDKSVAAVYGRQLPAKDCGVIEAFTRSFNYPAESSVKAISDLKRLGIKTFFCSNVCAAYRRDIYEKIGGFPLKTIFNEDMIFTGRLVKAGYKVAYRADAMVIHSHNYSGIQQFHRNFDLAVSQAQYPDVFDGVSSEGEGIKLVKKTATYLLKSGKWYLLPKLVYQSGCKYIGYFLGKRYKELPIWLCIWCSMNKDYWKTNK